MEQLSFEYPQSHGQCREPGSHGQNTHKWRRKQHKDSNEEGKAGCCRGTGHTDERHLGPSELQGGCVVSKALEKRKRHDPRADPESHPDLGTEWAALNRFKLHHVHEEDGRNDRKRSVEADQDGPSGGPLLLVLRQLADAIGGVVTTPLDLRDAPYLLQNTLQVLVRGHRMRRCCRIGDWYFGRALFSSRETSEGGMGSEV